MATVSLFNLFTPSVRAAAVCLGLSLLLLGGCKAGQAGSDPSSQAEPDAHADVHEWFTERAGEAGLDFVHFNGMSGEFYFPEIMAPGVALLDVDNDGDLDVFFVQGQMLGTGRTLRQALIQPRGPLPLKGRLYRNDLQVDANGTRTLRFTDITDGSGIDARGYGMGAATGDFNNDGCVDLYVTNLGRNGLFRNNCDGTFADVSRRSGTDDDGWGVSASFVDYDRDGWLDLYVANYVHYSVAADKKCIAVSGQSGYCPPNVYRPQSDRLFRNQRNGTFVDVTATALGGGAVGSALGVVAADFDRDGWPDIYVANDGEENHLWMNQRDGTFRNTALLAGAALDGNGQPQASMGVDAGDFDNDGDEDVFMTHLTDEGTTLYVNDGSGLFEDQSARRGVGPLTLGLTGFGTAWLDVDNDGWLDILQVNGTIQAAEGRQGLFPHDQRVLLLRNMRDGRFEDVSSRAAAALQPTSVGRGAAFGDLDNDGDIDVLVANATGSPRLLINNIGNRNHWLGLRLVGEADAPRDMLGARVAVVRKAGPPLWRRARADGSYASANDPRVLVGLGDSAAAPTVRVHWPSGRIEQWTDVALDRWVTFKEGSGRAQGS